jgi:hypothetical protein
VAHMTSYRLAEKVKDLADIIRRESGGLGGNANRLKDLFADRAKGLRGGGAGGTGQSLGRGAHQGIPDAAAGGRMRYGGLRGQRGAL